MIMLRISRRFNGIVEYYAIIGEQDEPEVMARPVVRGSDRKFRMRKRTPINQPVVEFDFPDRDYQFEGDRDDELRERDYYEQLELMPESRYPDRYGWDQYDR